MDSELDTAETALIVQMRIYDALMAVLTHLAPGKASDLYAAHAAGRFIGAPPFVGQEPFTIDE